ncbi:MAG TPA: mechanosensitive ion channel family protein [Gemmataceae bacterium]|nr:mechanosensitive ion channel family protein [Gemmataceae bacterium]
MHPLGQITFEHVSMTGGVAWAYAGRLLGAVLIVAAGWLAVHFLVGPIRHRVQRSRADPSVASFVVNSLRAAIVVVVILAVLQQLGVETTSLLTVLAAAGLAVALSLQSSLANFASGLLVLSFRMVRVGDQIELGDIRGKVTELLPFHIELITADNQRITVPNTQLTNLPVRNLTALLTRRVQWLLPLKPQDDLEAVKNALLTSLRADTRILAEPPPQLYLQEWSEDKRLLAITAWTATPDALAVQQERLEPLGQRLEELRKERTGVRP